MLVFASVVNRPPVSARQEPRPPRDRETRFQRTSFWEGEATAEPCFWNRTPDDTDDTEKEYAMLVPHLCYRCHPWSTAFVTARREPCPPEIVKLDSKERHDCKISARHRSGNDEQRAGVRPAGR